MRRIRPWLLVAIIAVGVGVYLALTSLGPEPEPEHRESAQRSSRGEQHNQGRVTEEPEPAAPAPTGAPELVAADLGGSVGISGWVLAPDGRPVSGAEVRGRFAGSATTDTKGAFLLTGLESGAHLVLAKSPRYAPVVCGPFSIPRDHELRGVTVRLVEGGFICGTVRDEEGDPVQYREVEFTRIWEEEELSEDTLWLGRFAVYDDSAEGRVGRYRSPALPPAEYVVKAWHPDWICDEERRVTVSAGGTVEDVDFVLDAGVTITGRVVDAHGEPVWGAWVDVLADSPGSSDITISNEEGAFCLRALRPGTHALKVFARDFIRHTGTIEAPAEDVVIVLDRGGRIFGRVLDKDTREPVELFWLDIRPEEPAEALTPEGRAEWLDRWDDVEGASSYGERPGGRFEHTGLRSWRYSLTVSAEDYLTSTVKGIEVRKDAEPEEVVVELDPGTTVELFVTDARDGTPVEGAEVVSHNLKEAIPSALPKYPTTDAEGVCSFGPLEPGLHVETVLHERFGTTTVRFEVAPGERRKTIAVALEKGFTVSGIVVARENHVPIKGASAVLAGRRDYKTKTDETGRFSLDGIDRDRYVLIVSAFGFATLRRPLDLDRAPQEELVIELGRGGTIAGRVADAEGSPIAGASVQIRTPILNACFEHDMKTDSQGEFSVPSLAPGAYRVVAISRDPGFRHGVMDSRRVVVREGEVARADFVLGAGVAVFGRITYGGEPVADASVSASLTDGALYRTDIGKIWTTGDNQGRYRIEGLSPGRYVLAVDTTGQDFDAGYGDMTYALQVAAQDAELDLDLAADVVAGVVQDSEDRPCWMARVDLVPLLEGEGRLTAINSVRSRGRTGFEARKDGTFRISGVAPGRYRLYVCPPTYESTTIMDINKEPGRDVTDLVVTIGETEAVEGCATTEDGEIPEYVEVAICDGQGRFIANGGGGLDAGSARFPIADLVPGEYAILARAQGYGLARARAFVGAGRDTVVEFAFQRGSDLIVKTRDASGIPVPGANVVLDIDADFLITAETYQSRLYADFYREEFLATDETGSKFFRHVADGDYTLRVRCEGYEDAAVPVRVAGGDEAITVTLKRANLEPD